MSCSPPAAALSRRAAPLGPMPNEDIDVSNLERLKKYRSFDRYRRRAEREARDPPTGGGHTGSISEEESGGVLSWAVTCLLGTRRLGRGGFRRLGFPTVFDGEGLLTFLCALVVA